jgi:glucose/mannose-6-phosphate isomerase
MQGPADGNGANRRASAPRNYLVALLRLRGRFRLRIMKSRRLDMLDQADFVGRYDKLDMLGELVRLPEQLAEDFPKLKGFEGWRPENIVLAGMGGSGLPGEFVRSWLDDRLKCPLVVVRDYTLPEFVGPQTLVIVSSYSGNTEETLNGLAMAKERKARILAIAAGGKLLDEARQASEATYELPKRFESRLSVLYAVKTVAMVLEAVGAAEGIVAELEEAGSWLAGQGPARWRDAVQKDNEAKQIASELVGHGVVLYAGAALAFGALKWKIAINESAKNLAFYNYLPDMNHNEFSGWSFPREHGMKVVELRSSLDHPRVMKRFEVMNRLLSNRWAPIEVEAAGETKLQQMLWTMVLGEFVALYLGVLNQVDVASLPLVDKLKRELG